LQGRSRGASITSDTDERHDDAALPSARCGLWNSFDASGAAPSGLAKRITFPIYDGANADPYVSNSNLLLATRIGEFTISRPRRNASRGSTGFVFDAVESDPHVRDGTELFVE
jgi:hypothetical protein